MVDARKQRSKINQFFLILFGLAVTVTGVQYEAATKKADRSLKLPERRKYQHADKIDVLYDKFTNQTTVAINYPSGMKVENTSLDLGLLFVFKGQLLAQAVHASSKLTLMISSKSESWEYLQFGRDLNLIVDGQRMPIGTLDRDGTVGEGYVLEFMSANISAAQLLKLANAKSIEGKLSLTEFSLSSDQIETIKDFASRLSGGPVDEAMDPIKPIPQ
jgi:hypothetical protein